MDSTIEARRPHFDWGQVRVAGSLLGAGSSRFSHTGFGGEFSAPSFFEKDWEMGGGNDRILL